MKLIAIGLTLAAFVSPGLASAQVKVQATSAEILSFANVVPASARVAVPTGGSGMVGQAYYNCLSRFVRRRLPGSGRSPTAVLLTNAVINAMNDADDCARDEKGGFVNVRQAIEAAAIRP